MLLVQKFYCPYEALILFHSLSQNSMGIKLQRYQNLKVLYTCWLGLQAREGVCPLPPPQLASVPVKVGPIDKLNHRAIVKWIIVENLRLRMLRVFNQGPIDAGNGIRSQFSRGVGLILPIEVEILFPSNLSNFWPIFWAKRVRNGFNYRDLRHRIGMNTPMTPGHANRGCWTCLIFECVNSGEHHRWYWSC